MADSHSRPRFTDAEVLEALRAAAAVQGDPLSVDRYDAHQRAHGGPTSVRIIQRLGGWNAACRAAGLRTNAGRASYARRWTREQVLEHVAAYLAEGGSGSYAGYAAWAKEAAGAPSGQTVRNLFDGWAAAKAAAKDAAQEARKGAGEGGATGRDR